ncbi:hypothetical protein AOQ84DRAFT_44900 [Glonium stellatum]|uniref:C2H2-type domain-containing protein n=1 Tax=Glonium stellatum TaxID=574774 RepID=A0A8E2F0K2_9PEZI|nr:hypothetical protein AOQ84DRAFT_44900 [Glonium stellatum]
MDDSIPSLTSGESASDIDDLNHFSGRKKVNHSPLKCWLDQPPTEDPWSTFSLRERRTYGRSQAIAKLIDSYGLVGYPPKAGIPPSPLHVDPTRKALDGSVINVPNTQAVTDTCSVKIANGLVEPLRQDSSRRGSTPLKPTKKAKPNIKVKVSSVSENQLLEFSARRLDDANRSSTNVRLRAAVLCCDSDLLDLEVFRSSFIKTTRQHKVNDLSSLLPGFVVPLARAWNKPYVYIGLSAKRNRHSQKFTVLLRAFTLLTYRPRAESNIRWHVHEPHWRVSRVTECTPSGATYSTELGGALHQSYDGGSQSSLNITGKRKAENPSGSAGNNKRLKITAADLPAAPSESRLACPFCKHNPRRYRNVHNVCTFPPGFADIKNFMEHLKRVHAPPRCNTCKIKFSGPPANATQARDAHRAANTCAPQTESRSEPELMTEHQEKVFTLKSVQMTIRKRRADSREKWSFVYRYLFNIPARTEIPHPYYDHYIMRDDMIGLDISREQPELPLPNTQSPSVILENSTVVALSSFTNFEGTRHQPLLVNNDTEVLSAFEELSPAPFLFAPPEVHGIDGERPVSLIPSRNHRSSPSSSQAERSTGATIREIDPLDVLPTAPTLPGSHSTTNSEGRRSHLDDGFSVGHQTTVSSYSASGYNRLDYQLTRPNRPSSPLGSLEFIATENLRFQRWFDINPLAVPPLSAEGSYPDISKDIQRISSSNTGNSRGSGGAA